MKHAYTFSDWETGHRPENAPPDEILDTLPAPRKRRVYRPAWGKWSRSAEKAVCTRNHGIREANLYRFRFEVLPAIVETLDPDSLFDAGEVLKDPALIDRSGFRFYRVAADGRGSWLHESDPRIAQALELGAAPITPAEYFTLYPATP